ncbi:MAG: hypothetical protein ACRED4_06500 [Brevundimonas sp.]
MKATYETRHGAVSIVYLDEDPDVATEGDTLTGRDKYTWNPVTVRLSGNAWLEVVPDTN